MDNFISANLSLTELSAAVILINLALSFFLGLTIALVYQRTHKGISYSRSYVESLVMMAVLSAIAMMILGNNLVRALGILGVFTLIRFRTIIKDPKDATFLFFSLAIGMGVGTGNYPIAFLGTLALAAIIFVLHKYNFGSVVREGFLLTFVAEREYDGSHEKFFSEYLKSFKLLQLKSGPEGENEYYFSVTFKEGQKPETLIKRLSQHPRLKLVDLISGQEAAEY